MSTSSIIRLAITPGEPAGIGPDIVLQLAQQPDEGAEWTVFADPKLLAQRALQLGLPIQLQEVEKFGIQAPQPHKAGCLQVVPVSTQKPVQAGQLCAANAMYVLESLSQACQACQRGWARALVTGPVHKGIINEAGIPFTGHTEFLAAQTGTERVVMMLATPRLRVALLTTHVPLKQVSEKLDKVLLAEVIWIVRRDLQRWFGLTDPLILVCGLNPHAGEGGYLGTEEQEIMIPVLDCLRDQGIRILGPVPADTAFTTKSLQEVDVVLTMYHDQGLPVLKSQGFGEAVNVTLGLPIIRTSVDHGTALSLAGTGKTDSRSLFAAIEMAKLMGNCDDR